MLNSILILIIIGLAVGYAVKPTVEPFVDGFPSDTIENAGPATYHPSAAADEEDDPRDLPWISSWSSLDRKARAGQNSTPKHTEAGPGGTTIVSVSKSSEDGLPHTRDGDRIYIPDSVLMTDRAHTIRHEMVHIYQRRDPQRWTQFYRRAWGFELHQEPPTDMPPWIVKTRRSNPDTWRDPWPCWQGRVWPVAVYRDPVYPSLRAADVIWWDSWRREVLRAPPADWIAFFGHPAQPEHPHEIAAVILTNEDNSSEAGRRLLNWWHTTLPGL